MMKRILFPALAIAAFALAFSSNQAGISANPPPPQPSPLPLGQPVPDISLKGLDGKYVKLSSLRGKPVFIDFWATWCGPCRLSLPHTAKLAKEHGKEITVLAVTNEDVKTIKAFQQEEKLIFPALRDPDDTVRDTFKVTSLPTFVIIDAQGNLVEYVRGFANQAPIDNALFKVGIK